MYTQKVYNAYAEAVALNPVISLDLRIALKTNERVPHFITKLANEFMILDKYRARKGRPPVSDKHIKDIVYDMVGVFIQTLEAEAKRRNESEIDRHAREAEASNKTAIEKAAAGEMTGDFKDMGLVAVDSRDV